MWFVVADVGYFTASNVVAFDLHDALHQPRD
jgi:hypothetical protein